MKKIAPYLLFISSIIFLTFLWDSISLPFNEDKSYLGDSYANNLHHSQNDTLRFVLYLSIPFLILIFFYQIYEKIFFINVKDIILKYDLTYSSDHKNLIFFFGITIIFIIIEFFFIDFKVLNHQIDIFHEGLWLTPSNNAIIKDEFWQSSYVERGFFGNFYPYLLWKFFNIESIGVTRFLNLFVIFFNKVFLMLIAYRIASVVNLEKKQKIIFYLLLSLTLLIYTSYFAPVFFLRSLLLLIFIFLFLNFIILENKKIINLIAIGLLSSLSLFWYIDIGIYINTLILFILIVLILKKKFAYVFSLSTFIILGWVIFYAYISENEFNQFINNTKLLIVTIDYIHGLIFPTPFLSQDTRSTKVLILFLITGFLIIKEINFAKKKEFKFLLITTFLFITSILYFKYGLSRSDGGHIKVASSFLYIPLFSILYFKILQFIFNQNKISFIRPNYINTALLIIFFSTIFLNKKYEIKSPTNFIHSKDNIQRLLNYSDNKYISKDYQNFILQYKELSSQDECVMIYTNEVALPYLLKKPTCSKHYLLYLATPPQIQKNIIKDLNISTPKYLVYKSDVDAYGHVGDRLKLLDGYIKENYNFYQKISHWEIYKKKK